jgi:hypothetical protein
MRADLANVRFAEAADEPDLMAVARAVHDEFGLRDGNGDVLPFCENSARALIRAAMEPERAGTVAWIGVIGKRPGELEGSVCLLRGRHPLANTAYLSEFWNWAAPSHRYAGTRKTLVAFSKTFARALRMPLISGVMASGDEAQERFYARAGGERLGSIWAFHGELGVAQ